MGPLTLLVAACLAAAAPLTLDDALAHAVRRNADLAVSRAQQEAAAVEARASYQGVLPRLDLTGAFGRQFNGTQQQANVVTNPTPPPDFVREVVSVPSTNFGLYQYGLAFSWTVFDGLGAWDFISASRTRSQAASRQYDESSLRLAFDVTRLFYELLKQERALAVRKETEALSAQLVDRADALFKAGRGTKADTYSARVNLGNDRIATRNQAAAVTRARADLAAILGLSSDAELEIVPPQTVAGPGLPRQPELPALSALLADARKRRPALVAGRLTGEASDLEIARARAAFWPTIGLQANYQRQTPDVSGSFGLFGNPSNNYVATAQVTLGLNLFAGFSTVTGVQRAEAEARRAWALLAQQEQVVNTEVAVSREQVATLTDTAATIQENVQAAQDAVRFARERLDAGVGSQLEVRDAIVKLADARLQWVNAVIDLVVARADLNRAVGGAL